ncbi:MAG: VapC toxin family PIN domain ribonuclease [Candidatus Goldiibacteriota bacterium HGW-Goldbacteria-1]|jgi:predicted nucleic acid-binding protein|nr:MAG: VapC toxin family PIN domain ribonuclease [Candidatus Goldiibacteriota bacterium HGW-Goldbacteria-1]
MEKVIIDTYAMTSLMFGEPNSAKIAAYIKEWQAKKTKLIMSSVNFGELYYIILRQKGIEAAEALRGIMASTSIEIEVIDIDTAIAAAGIKAHKKMSYADCFAAALAKIHKAPVLTGDKEFKEVEGEIKVIWV